MVSTLWLLGCVLTPAQVGRPVPTPPPPGLTARGNEWVLAPRLARSQELVYRGTYTEEAAGPRVQFNSAYRVEVRAFVLDTPPRGLDLAVLTTLQASPPRGAPVVREKDRVALSVRLEKLAVDLQGQIIPEPGVSLRVPLDAAPTLEGGFFLATPGGRVRPGQTWDEPEAGRPVRSWKTAGTEVLNGNTCFKLQALQQSDDWDHPRADRSAWRRRDTVWISPRTGVAARVERIVEQREPGRSEPTAQNILRYDLESSLQYPGPLSDDRRQEILQAFAFRAGAAPFLAPSGGRNDKALLMTIRKINYHLENQPPTPYRPAIVQVKRQLEAVQRGESPTVVAPATSREDAPPPKVATLGQPAPDFSASQIGGGPPLRLGAWHSRPVLLVFYQPASHTTTELLRFCQHLHSTSGKYLTVVGLSVSDDSKTLLAQRDNLKLTFPLLNGGGVCSTYGVETTPKIVLIDAAGIVRGDYLGWGRETPEEILAELKRWWPK